MASTTLAAKRMAKERLELQKENLDYFVRFEDDNILKFDAYVFGPEDTPYYLKLVKLRFEIPARYPMLPPTVKFIQHTGERIHPNLYVEGKVCLSILGTWPGEPWAYGMTCHTVLITIRSLLDNQPYTHEPNQPDNPAFTSFVEYSSWKCLLLDYLDREAEHPSKMFLAQHLRGNADKMRAALAQQALRNAHLRQFTSPYSDLEPSSLRIPRYSDLADELEIAIAKAESLASYFVTGTALEPEARASSSRQGQVAAAAQEAPRAPGKNETAASTDHIVIDSDDDDDDNEDGNSVTVVGALAKSKTTSASPNRRDQKPRVGAEKSATKGPTEIIDLT